MKKPITVARLSKLFKQAEREAWTELDLSNQQLTEVPPIIGKLKALEVLDLTNNRLTALPNVIGELVNLKELKIG
jgi:Leucine-rich repeat (LRR) protein